MAHFVETGDGAFVNLDLVAEISYDADTDTTTYRIIGESIWISCKGSLLEGRRTNENRAGRAAGNAGRGRG